MLRLATNSDIDRIRQWRNHPVVRAVSTTSHEITEAEHAAWWSRARADTRTRVLIFELDDEPCGVVTFTDIETADAAGVDGQTATWGFHLDVESLDRQGRTLSAWLTLVGDAIGYAFDDLKLEVLRGEVLEHNTVVRRMNRRFGFVEGEPIERDIGGQVVRSRPIELRRTGWPGGERTHDSDERIDR